LRWGQFLFQWATPTLLGNCFGGVALVAVINYAQMEAGGRGGGGES
jgi:formate/nitrite transporter FocA (FNT family)